MQHILNLDLPTLTDWAAERKLPGYRARQVWHWLYQRRCEQFEEMTQLPKSLRSELAQEFTFWSTSVAAHQVSQDGTEKLLLELTDGHRVECVLLRQGPLRRTICISTQVGCAMGCVFCASGLDGVARNLKTGEIVEQVLRLNRLLSAEERLSHIVVMGMGEPLANLDRLLPALDQVCAPESLGISPRRVTISTVGIPPAIERLAAYARPFHLAVSLHAADDTLRNTLVPVNQGTGLNAILAAADRYFEISGRRLTFEYVMLADINDQDLQARRLTTLLAGREALVNLIPFNPVDGLPYQTPSMERVDQFVAILESGGLNVKVRRRKGDEIDAACGQLRRRRPGTPSTVELLP